MNKFNIQCSTKKRSHETQIKCFHSSLHVLSNQTLRPKLTTSLIFVTASMCRYFGFGLIRFGHINNLGCFQSFDIDLEDSYRASCMMKPRSQRNVCRYFNIVRNLFLIDLKDKNIRNECAGFEKLFP